ncbi:MAG: HDIG domain-containing protein [Flavobacteriaceae bacterium]|nr:HDIG domain-containing protein [Flavobacteriaceae bacterium]
MKNFIDLIFDKHAVIYKLLLYIITTALIVYLFPKGGHFKYEFQKGKAWQYENYYAPFDFAIQKSAEEIELEKQRIQSNAQIFFDTDSTVIKSSFQTFGNKFQILANELKIAQKDREKLFLIGKIILGDIYQIGIIGNVDELKIKQDFNTIIVRNGNNVQEINPNDLIKSSEIRSWIQNQSEVRNFGIYKNNLIEILVESIAPNIFYDDYFTQKSLEEAINQISLTTDFISEKERIILKGDIVEGRKLAILNSLKKEFQSQIWTKSNYKWIVLGYSILVALSLLMIMLFIKKYRVEIYENNTKVTFIYFNLFLAIFLTTVVVKYNAEYVYIVPLSILPIIIKAFFDPRLGLYTHVLTILLLGFIVPNSFEFTFLQIIAGIVTILTVSEMYKRTNLFISVAQITLVYFITYFAFSILQEGNIQQIKLEKFVYFALNGTLILFVLPFIYVFEKLFGLVSDESLKELSNTNSKILRILAEKAPGTFQHSIQVANLSEAAANEINANALLARTGALYHDIGKIKNPMYFIENQSTNFNPHLELSPKDSASIIISHVDDGIKLAKKYRIPERIIDFIRTHHGSSLVYYFYRNQEEINPEGLDKSLFKYKGPIPFSKETAIVMMCDSCEAASKSLKEPSGKLIDEMVEKIVQKQMDEGQYMNADITFKDIQTVKKVIKKKLKNIYHLRIEYPE